MIQFTLSQIAFSVLGALLFGVFVAALFTVASVVVSEIKVLPSVVRSVLVYTGKPWKIGRMEFIGVPVVPKSRLLGELLQFFKIVLFSLLFLVLSYVMLDGKIRVYMLALSLLSLFLTRVFLGKTLYPAVMGIVGTVFWVSVIVLRLFAFLPRRIFVRIKKIF